jgi:16S rRNA processing protein RimM
VQGRIGEVAAEILTDFPERFAQRRRLFLLDRNGSRRELHLENSWPHKERLVLKFAGVDSISDAETLLGGEIQIPAEERAHLDGAATYISDLIGCEVFVCVAPAALHRGNIDLRFLGKITGVLAGAGDAPILEIRDGTREHMVPFAQEYILRLDTAAKRLELQLPEGMLDLGAPLSEQEKQAQQQKDE